jgi:hypothetical protein
MISIGLIEQLQNARDKSAVVTYFFCQHANSERNSIEAIIKGLILRLANEHVYLRESLRRRWDTANQRFEEDMTTWRALWQVFREMLECCKSQRIYVVVDALDECQVGGMTEFLKLVVRTGLGYHSKIKWLLTSRPLDSAEQQLLGSTDQDLVSLELNSRHVAAAVKMYAASRAVELDRQHRYGPVLRQAVETALVEKAEDTFLWISLVCGRLELVDREKALDTIKQLPAGLQHFYDRILQHINKGSSSDVEGCMQLLKVMLLVYRPLRLEEIPSVTGRSDNTQALVDRCASFVRKRDTILEFVHKSAPDYLRQNDGQSILNAYHVFEHGNIALSCLNYLDKELKVNLLGLPLPSSTRDSIGMEHRKLAHLDYCATFLLQHLHDSWDTPLIQQAFVSQGQAYISFRRKILEWLECLSLLGELPRTAKGLRMIRDILQVGLFPFIVQLSLLITYRITLLYQTL